jgi:radical SAM superfamily enzyme YgiQ (UPF0313 family)
MDTELRVTLVELSAFESMMPLVSGYLQTYARRDPEIVRRCAFDVYTVPAPGTDPTDVVEALRERGSDVYGISCYVWNMGLVRRLLPELLRARPDAYVILGGPQVMRHAADYVPPGADRVVVCDGEGEVPFHRFLVELLGGAPDFAAVPGLSFWRDGELVTTPKPDRIRDLMEIPSPFDTEVFPDGLYSTAILETNRGCPFHCSFCYWGAATNDKVNKLELQRVLDDVTWISEHRYVALFIADANWGMSPRDIEVTKHLVACRERTGYPLMVSVAAAKNRPERMAEISEILVRGGLLTTQPISLQTLSPLALQMVERANIRPETYTVLQQALREKRISSYIELIWPLPGETLDSFRDGIATLCRSGADTIIAYPHLLLHNTPMYERQELLGLRMERVPEEVAEADIVVETNWVSRHQYEQGVWFAYAMHSLYNLRGLYYLANYLDRTGTAPFAALFTAAAEHFQRRLDDPVCAFFANSVTSLANYSMLNNGEVGHLTLHQHRATFTALLAEFVRTQPWWNDPRARAAFELDLVARPYIYHERFAVPDYAFTEIDVVAGARGEVTVTVPEPLAALVVELDVPELRGQAPARLRMNHAGDKKMPFMPQRSLEHNLSYCQGMVMRLREFLPRWSADAPAPVGG